MADKSVNNISLKALVEKRSNKVIFIESDNDFVDVLFSFLTIPMGTIIRLACKHTVPLEIGCIKNLYASVKNADKRLFQTEVCREMLLCPRNGVESHCENLKFKLNNGDPTRYFLCSKEGCTRKFNLFSHYKGVLCECGKPMDREMSLSAGNLKSSSLSTGGVLCKGLTRFIISDDLEVMPPLNSAVSSFLTKVGVMDVNTTEEMTFNVGFDEVLNLLICSFVSKTPLTDILLKHKPEPNLSRKGVKHGICVTGQTAGETDKNIFINLVVSKSKKMVCYAEAGVDFVNLLFSFLTVPLGFILNEMHDSSSSTKGCIDQLYKSVQDLDEHYFESYYEKEILLAPKLYPGFGYENHLLGIEDGEEASYYYGRYWTDEHASFREILTDDKTIIPCTGLSVALKLKYCKSQSNYRTLPGFLGRPAMFTITDSLMIRPISPLFGLSVLKELKVPFSDIEVKTVLLGEEEGLRLLVTSFLCDSALTSVFLSHIK